MRRLLYSGHVWFARIVGYLFRFGELRVAAQLARTAPKPVVLRRIFGRRIVLDLTRSNVQRLIWLQGERFVAERKLVRSLVRPCARVVDVGANIGYYMLLFEQAIGPQGQVTCVEPEPTNLRDLRATVAANGLTNVAILPVAAGRTRTTAALTTGINGMIASPGEGGVPVAMAPLDELVSPPVDFIKIDVEGYELEVVKGALGIIESYRPTLFVEVHPALIGGRDRLRELLDLLHPAYPDLRTVVRADVLGGIRGFVGRYATAFATEELPIDGNARCLPAFSTEEPYWLVGRGRGRHTHSRAS